MKNEIKLIITITLCLMAIATDVMFVDKITRRSGEEWAIMNQSKIDVNATTIEERKIKSCLDGGGLPNYYQGVFEDCRTNN